MPRRAFIADVEAVAEKSIPGITSVARGDDDGEVIACFAPASGVPIDISLLAQPDVASYPEESSFMIFTNSPDVPQMATTALQELANYSSGMRLTELIPLISQKLYKALATGSREDPLSIHEDSDVPMTGVDEIEASDDSEVESYDGFSSDDEGLFSRSGPRPSAASKIPKKPEEIKSMSRRIRHDVSAVKMAGFSIGILSGMKGDSTNSLLSISIRVAKLGLSEEAIQAWDLEPQQYIVLLIRYSHGYKTFETIMDEPAVNSLDIAFRIGISNKYKPTYMEALASFTDVPKEGTISSGGGSDEILRSMGDLSGFSNLFISSSLNKFMEHDFISLLKIRHSMGYSWNEAKLYFNTKQSVLDSNPAYLPEDFRMDTPTKPSTLPDIVTADHLTDNHAQQTSFPLIATQFALRYLVRCTEFCLVCHDKIEEDFGALKPYVCSKPLCLYQYMSLGFGPSVEHEIMTQPYVVDLLVSFCYASARNLRLREYPTGMSLMVPPNSGQAVQPPGPGFVQLPVHNLPAAVHTMEEEIKHLDVKYDPNHQEIIFENIPISPVSNGNWVIISVAGRAPEHYRVEDVSLFPTVKLSSVRVTRVNSVDQNAVTIIPTPVVTPATTPPPQAIVSAQLSVYNKNFDDMSDVEKSEAIVMLLETLPPIKVMQSYLIQQLRYSEPSLTTWRERISPAALGILRWVIASNRSCIVQVDKCPGQDDDDVASSKIRLDQRVSNMSESWVQFRFAQGSPDKEQRFLNALREQQASLDPKYPTIFAFHGSPLPNWHSIIRSGLDFKEVQHGRAFGHGVYHAQDQTTSLSYAHHNQAIWENSALKICSSMSLNEIVNCPSKFQSSNPYLVVQHIDWIQCRYLFVQVTNYTEPYRMGDTSTSVSHAPNISMEVLQDPKYSARSTLHKTIGVPLCAVSVSRAFRVDSNIENLETGTSPSSKRRKDGSGTGVSAKKTPVMEMAGASEGENLSDIEFLYSDNETTPTRVEQKSVLDLASVVGAKPLTDFKAGSLDQSSLPMLEPPSYATPVATKTLNRSLQEVLQIQKNTPLHELGWYIDQDLISNVYQWIVELHSFDSDLPLAKDMKAAGLTSVVLEIRYGKDFPFSPPFVRVIRPRFLPFMSGGGGHVTAGGAMCMELLTNSGWSSVSTIESVLLQVRMAIMNTEPKPARLERQGKGQQRDYGTGEAIDAYIRACQAHGWQIPPGFRDFAGAGPSSY